MSLWHCADCTTAYAAGLPACPHCQSATKEEDGVPKNTKAGGPSYEGHVDVSSSSTLTPEWAPADEAPPAPQVEPVEPEKPEKPQPTPRTTRKAGK